MNSILLILALASSAFSEDRGDKELNGGGGVACMQPDGSVQVQVLDLYLAEQNGARLITTKDGRNDWLQDFVVDRVHELHASLGKKFEDTLVEVQSIWEWSKKPVPIPKDTGIQLKLEENCRLVGLANFNDISGRLEYDSQYVPLLDPINRLALDAHETLSKIQRESLADFQDTSKVMLTIGEVFSLRALDLGVLDVDQENESVRCKSKSQELDFTAVLDGGDTVLNFHQLPEFPVIEQTTAKIEGRKLIRDLEHGAVFTAQAIAVSKHWPDFNLKISYGDDFVRVHFLKDDSIVQTYEVACVEGE